MNIGYLAGLLAAVATARPLPEIEQSRPTPTVKPADYSLSIKTKLGDLKAGSEIKLEIVQTNVSSHPIEWSRISKGRESIEAQYRVYIYDEKGNLAPETDYGRHLMAGDILWSGSDYMITLKPGESQTDEIRLNKLYVLNPGKYTVQIEPAAHSPDTTRVRSNILPLIVTK